MSRSPSSSPSSSAATAIATAIPLSTALATIAAPSPITALPAPNSNSVSRRCLPPPCWTNEETLALIDSYKEKWYSLNRSNLRAAHWDDVAAAVATRSHQIPAATLKTSVQCRHKIEKLRKRYRSERQRSLAHNPHAPPSSPWIFFSKMDQMENPNPIPNWYQDVPNGSGGGGGGGGVKFKIPKAVRTSVGNPNPNWYEGCDDDDGIEYRQSGGNGGGLKFKIPKAVRSSVGNPNLNSNYNPSPSYSVKPGLEEMRRLEAKRRREGEEDDDEGDSSSMGEMARALRMFGDGYMRMEQKKMEMAREMERARMEMELERTEMILDTQKRIVDAFVKGVVGEKKVERSPNC